MNIWVPDPWSDEDDKKLEEMFKGDISKEFAFEKEQLNKAKEKWDQTDWNLENSYYELKVKLPKNMEFNKDEITAKWSNNESLKKVYDPQDLIIEGNTLIFRAKFKTLKSDIALNLDGEIRNEDILNVDIPMTIHYKKGDTIMDYVPEVEQNLRLVDKSKAIQADGKGILSLFNELYPMDLSDFPEELGGFPVNQKLDGDILGNKTETESNNYFSINKDEKFDVTTKLNVQKIKDTVSNPASVVGFEDAELKFNEHPIFRFWPALDLGSVFSCTLRFPKEIIVPEDINESSLELLGSQNVYYISKVERSTDPETGETLLKIEMPLTEEAKKMMPSIYDLSNTVLKVDSNFYINIPGLKLSDEAVYGEKYTVKGQLGGKVFFRTITDVDDWVASEYKDELREKFGEDVVVQDDTWKNVTHFNEEDPNVNEAIDYMLDKHPEIFGEVIPNLLNDSQLRRKYDTNIYSLFVNWKAIQEEGGRDFLYSQEGGDLEDITFTVLCSKKAEPTPEPEPTPIPEPEIKPQLKIHEYTPTYPVYASVDKKEVETKEVINTHDQYIFGYPDDTIRPDGDMTRAEAIAVVARLQKLDLSDKSSKIYKDTKADMWYNGAINAAFKAGYLLEKEGENVRPNDKITRAELAELISHIDKKNNTVAPFDDVKGHKFEAAINQAYGNERIKGYPDGTFKPDNTITRAEVATMLNKLYERYPDKNFIDANQDTVHNYKDMSYKGHWGYYELVEAYHSHTYLRLKDNMEEWKDIIK
ncbi:S-layer homology domain-containing protein [Peptoniphilus timonensis]|uniref:S-layer homology domain-containing protein n=1 Tax=Peptoniphilus timonensis TaxID=1268254 RepID=UPI00031C2FA5|nr:S-layer homology domain-containing protein [Peptoniphilus timonensis]